MKNMDSSIKIGMSFGLTSGIITTLGLMVGLGFGTASKLVVIGGILTISIADALSDSLGIHISQESDKQKSSKQVWKSTFATMVSKFIFAITFLIPVLFLSLFTAIFVSVLWGLLLLSLLSFFIAKQKNEKPLQVIGEHLAIAIIVIIITYLIGKFISVNFS